MKNLSKYQFNKKKSSLIQTIFTDDESKLSVEKCFLNYKKENYRKRNK